MSLGQKRAYLLFRKSFEQTGCTLCSVLHSAVVEDLSLNASSAKRALELSRSSCPTHAGIVAGRLLDDLPMLSSVLEQQLADAQARRSRSVRRRWSWRGRDHEECPGCRVAARLEPQVLGWFLGWLGDIRFARSFRSASPLCILHGARALEHREARDAGVLAEAERPKLERLATDLVQHRYLGTAPELETVLHAYLVPLDAAPSHAPPAVDEEPPTRAEPVEPEETIETLALRAEIGDLTRRLGEVESRAAALQYRVSTLAEENRDWEHRYAAVAGESRMLRGAVNPERPAPRGGTSTKS